MSDIEDILLSGDFDRLIGLSEDAEFEAKREPYDLSDPMGRYELAKDVSAFANRNGGFLMIGPTTRPVETAQLDVVYDVKLHDESRIAVSAYHGVLREYVYPAIEGIRVEFVKSAESDLGIGVVFVPRQDPDRKPFIILRVVEDGQRLKHIVFGYVERTSDANDPMDGKHLQQTLKRGSDSLSQRLSRIETMLAEFAGAAAMREPRSDGVDRELLDTRIRDIAEDS